MFTPLTLALMLAACGGGGGGGGGGKTPETKPALNSIPLMAIRKAAAAHEALSTARIDDKDTASNLDDDVHFFTIAENTDVSSARAISTALTAEAGVAYRLAVTDAGDARLEGADNLFVINATTGIVSFKASGVTLDYEEEPKYKLNITLSKAGFHDAHVMFEVRLLDINEDRLIATAAQETHTGTDANGYEVSFENSGAAVVIDLSGPSASGGYAAGDTLSNIRHVIGSVHGDMLTGSAAVNILNGGGGDDSFKGLADADTLNGGGGSDTASYAGSTAVTINLVTGSGTGGHAAGDTLISIENIIGSDHADMIIANGDANVIDGGTGSDRVSYARSNAGVTVDLSDGAAEVGGYARGDVLSNIEGLTGSRHADRLTGSAASNSFDGGDGDDILTGLGGGDALNGGRGNDTASYAGSNAGVTVDLSNNAASGGHAAGDTFISIENLTGSAEADMFTGTNQVNILTGGGGADVLRGLGGRDTLNGGGGDDRLNGGAGADMLNGGGGSDTVTYIDAGAGVTIDLGLNTAQNSANEANGDIFNSIENIIGSGHDDVIISNDAANNINGGAGSDTVSYAKSNAGVTVDLSNSTAEVGGHAAGDVLSNIENFIGSDHSDTFIGDGNANVFMGGRGIDRFTGGGGDDIYVLDTRLQASNEDQVTDFRNSGNDKIRVDVDNPNAVTTLAELKTEARFIITSITATNTQTNTILQHPVVGNVIYMVLEDFASTDLTLAMFDIV